MTPRYELDAELEAAGMLDGRTPAPPHLTVSPDELRQVGAAAARAALSKGLRMVRADAESGLAAGAEFMANPIRRVYPDAMMEHLGHAASRTSSEAEAEAFVGALIPVAARLVPNAAPAIMRSAPGLVRGVAHVARTLRCDPATRPLVRVVPTIVRRTAQDLGRQATAGRPATPQQAIQTLATQTRRVLCDPRQARRALAQSVAADRRYHQALASQRSRVF